MISAMLGAFGAKSDKDTLNAMLDLIESDAEARATGLWKPLNVNATTLAIACRKLIATSKFVPKPMELADACREASGTMHTAEGYCDELTNYVLRCDALLLEFTPEQWREPYRLPQYQETVQRVLELHATHGPWIGERRYHSNEDEAWAAHFSDTPPPDDPNDEDYWVETDYNRSFRLALDRAKLEFPKPEEIEHQPDELKQLAACKKPTAKRTHKPRSSRPHNVHSEQ